MIGIIFKQNILIYTFHKDGETLTEFTAKAAEDAISIYSKYI